MSTLKVGTIQDHANSISAITIDSTGRVSRPVTPYIYMRGNNATEVTSKGTAEVYTDWAAEGSVLGGMSYNSSNGRFTVPINGIYQISATFYLWMNTAEAHVIYFRKNGTTIQEYITDFTAVGAGGRTDHTITISECLYLSANEYFDFYCDADIYGGNVHSKCQVVMVG